MTEIYQKFSTINSKFTVGSIKGREVVRKKYSQHVALNISLEGYVAMINDYHFSLRSAGIRTPEYARCFLEDEEIFLEQEYAGQNLFELGCKPDSFVSFEKEVIACLKLIRQAAEAGIMIDPHPKNFVFDDKGFCYLVDYYPPYSETFNQLRLDQADEKTFEIVKLNLSYFEPVYLAVHFCGDFLSIDKKYEKCFESIYTYAFALGLTKLELPAFIKLAKNIRRIEDLRLQEGIYLI